MSSGYEGPFGPLIETLRRVDADVIALQEVWDDGNVKQVDLLAEALGFHSAYEGRLDLDGVLVGNAVLSRWPIVDSGRIGYTGDGDTGEERVALRADPPQLATRPQRPPPGPGSSTGGVRGRLEAAFVSGDRPWGFQTPTR